MAEVFQPIDSSNISSAEWDADSEDLTVHFANGQRYMYRNVPHAKWRGFQQDPSAGGYLHRHIKGRHQHERL